VTAGAVRYTIVPEASEARYRVREQLADRPLPSDAVGVTRAISGTIVVTPSGALVPERSRITVDLRTLQSDSSRRDNFIRRNTLETDRFPLAEFVPREIRGLPSPPPSSGDVSFEIVGDLTVHGVTRPTTWQVQARVGDGDVTGTATTSFTFADFEMSRPRVAVVLSVEDTIRLELDFRLTRSAAPSG
jgi:polyisoprenoid-binding protein YceI